MTNTIKKNITLDYILYIHYLICFKKNNQEIKLSIKIGSKIKVITSIYTLKLGFQAQKTDVKAQKIDKSFFLNILNSCS